MKTFDHNQTGGLKLVTERLSELQDAYSIYTGLARMAGDKAILSGCEILGNTVTDGTVMIGGEILEFKGAVKQDTVIVKEDLTSVQFEDGSIKPFQKNRYATFGFSAGAYQWSQFKRVPVLIDIPQVITDLSTALNNKIDAFTNALGFLRKGEVFIGDINGKPVGWSYTGVDYTVQLINNVNGSNTGGDDLYQITFTNPLETNSYKVFTSVNYSGSYIANNDVIFTISNKTTTGFQLSARELSLDIQNLTVDYIIFKN